MEKKICEKKRTYNWDILKEEHNKKPKSEQGILLLPKKQRATKWLRWKDENGIWHFKLRGDNDLKKNYDYK